MGSIHAIGLASSHVVGEVGAALITSDGEGAPIPVSYIHFSMTDAAQALLTQAATMAAHFDRPGADPLIDEAATLITMLYVEAVRQGLSAANKSRDEIEIVGLSGHHIATSRETAPELSWTWCLGSGDAIAKACQMTVICDLPRVNAGNDLQAEAQAIALIAVRRLRLLPIGNASDGDALVGVIHRAPQL